MSATAAATIAASTKRSPGAVAGKVGAPTTHLATLAIVPGLPVSAETAQTVQLNSPREAKETYAFADAATNTLPDVQEGDILVIGAVEHVIRSVAEYPRPGGGSYVHIVYELQKVS